MSNVLKLKKRALEYEQKKQFDKALDAYMQVLGVLGDHVEEADVALFNRVGDLLLRQGNVGSAVDHYERAVDLYTDSGFHNNAIALCNKILRNAPGRSSIYYKLGRISAKKGFTNDAKQNFLEYADRMQRIGQFEEAFRALKEFADLCPDQDDIRLMLADQLVRGDRKTEAIDQLQFLFEKFDAEGRTREARATLERMKAIDPQHEPKPGVMRPTPKVNDLIFLDVNYDGPGRPADKNSSDAARRPASAPESQAPQADVAIPVQRVIARADTTGTDAPSADEDVDAIAHALDMADEPLPDIDIEPTMLMLDGDSSDVVDVAPVAGLSSGATFNPSNHAADESDSAYDIVSHTDAGFITGFEETSLGGTERDTDATEPISGMEHTDPGMLHDVAALDFQDETAETPAPDYPDAATRDIVDPTIDGGDFPLIDMPLELIDDSTPSSTGELTFIFPDSDAADSWKAEQGAGITAEPAGDAYVDGEDSRWSSLSEADLNLEPLLQLPEIGYEQELADESGETASAGARIEEPDDFLEDDSPSTGPELHFLDIGTDDEMAVPAPSEITGFEHLDIGAAKPPMIAEAPGAGEPALVAEPATSDESAPWEQTILDEPAAPLRMADALRASIELDPTAWELHRRLAEALLEEGDRAGGLAALESAMLGFERAGDIRSANALVDEMIRVEPREVRFHQKRVEYAVRSNDRSLLADAYFSLAESLFQMGELDKSRAVYGRVLELSPGDARARSALEAIGSTGATEVVAELASIPHPSTNGVASKAAPEPPPLPRAREEGPGAAPVDDFVNLSDWLREDEPTRNTRMVVDVKEPEIDDQVDFAEMLTMFKQGVAANVDESDHEAHYDLGVAYKEMGLLDEAISEFQKALRGTEQRARTYEALGQCFVEKGQPQIAVTILSRALGDKSYTDDMLVGVLYLLGYASETLGRWADAQRFYERVFAVDIEFRDIAERLATAERGGR